MLSQEPRLHERQGHGGRTARLALRTGEVERPVISELTVSGQPGFRHKHYAPCRPPTPGWLFFSAAGISFSAPAYAAGSPFLFVCEVPVLRIVVELALFIMPDV